MNKTVDSFIRKELKDGLAKLPESNQMMFKRIYSHLDLDESINNIVDFMPDEKLNWALTQVENSLKKIGLTIDKANP